MIQQSPRLFSFAPAGARFVNAWLPGLSPWARIYRASDAVMLVRNAGRFKKEGRHGGKGFDCRNIQTIEEHAASEKDRKGPAVGK